MMLRLVVPIFLVIHFIALCPRHASALDPPPRFHHTAWGEDSGLGAVYDVRQAPDGYLWLQTATGIFRSDGVRFESVDEVTHGQIHNSTLTAVLPSASGGIWFMTRNAGLLFWKNEHLTHFLDTRCIGRLREAPDGSLWIAGSTGLFHLQSGICNEIGTAADYPGGVPAGLFVDRAGTVWVKTWAGDLLFLPAGQSRFQISPNGRGRTATLAFLHQAPDGSVWLSDSHGLRRVQGKPDNDAPFRQPGPEHNKAELFGDFTFAADGSIWVVTDKGVRWSEHADQWESPQQMEQSPGEGLTEERGLTSDVVWAVLVDREGSIWTGTNSGLDQIRRAVFRTPILPHAQEHEFGVAAGAADSVWAGSESLALTHVTQDGQAIRFPRIGEITCLKTDRDGTLWVAGKGDNHLWRSSEEGFIPIPYPHDDSQPIISLAIDRDGGIWISLRQFGVYRFAHGVWWSENARLGRSSGTVSAMTEDSQGNVWLTSSNKLIEWDGNHYSTFSPSGDQPSFGNMTLAARNDHVWIPGTAALTLFSHGHFTILQGQYPGLPGRISGIVETAGGDLWLNGFSGVAHIPKTELEKWFKDSSYVVASERFNTLDGLPGLSGETVPTPSLVESAEGRLWFATTKGVAWVDPSALAKSRNQMPPPVAIAYVVADGKLLNSVPSFTLAPHPHSLEIDYTALSLAVPQRVLFRYKLEGLDKEWQNAGTRRQAYYNSLGPGHYRFRVIACNNDGVWNGTGATLPFSVAYAFYQTWWFLALVVIASLFAIWLSFRIRVRIITDALQGRLAERVEERERIARELHDTLLQGIFGLSLRLQSSVDRLEAGNPVREDITQALNQSDLMMLQGRERIRNLRESHSDSTSLVAAFEAYGRQLQGISAIQFFVSIDGEARPLNPLIQEEIVLIGREALTNAFRHSGASVIAVEVSFRWSALHVRIHDNGVGMDPALLESGARKDHWGLPNMRERAKKMRGELHIQLRPKGGTEVDLRVAGAVVYRSDAGVKSRLGWWPRKIQPDLSSVTDQES